MPDNDSPTKPRDALVFLLDRQADRLDAIIDGLAKAEHDRAAVATAIGELRIIVDRLALAAAEQATIAKEAAARAKEERDANAAAAAARWGAIGQLGDSKIAVAMWAMFGTAIGGALTAKLAAWLGLPVAAILGAKP